MTTKQDIIAAAANKAYAEKNKRIAEEYWKENPLSKDMRDMLDKMPRYPSPPQAPESEG